MRSTLKSDSKILILGCTGQIGSSLKKKFNSSIETPTRTDLNLSNKKSLKKYLKKFKFSQK